MTSLTDWHAHWFPPELVELLLQRLHAPRLVREGNGDWLTGADGGTHRLGQAMFDIAQRERELDASGVAHQVLSLPGLMGIDTAAGEDAPALVRAFNEGLARLVQQRPERFSGLALVPLSRLEEAPAILEDALGRLGLSGVILPTAAFRDHDTARAVAGVLSVADARAAHVFVHPGPLAAPPTPTPASDEAGLIRRGVLDIQNGLTAAAITLEFTSLLDEFPRLDVHVANLGGTLPFLVERIAHGAQRYAIAPDDAAGQRRRIKVDTASFGPRAIALAAQAFGADRILFGTDSPIFAISEARHALEASGIELSPSRPQTRGRLVA